MAARTNKPIPTATADARFDAAAPVEAAEPSFPPPPSPRPRSPSGWDSRRCDPERGRGWVGWIANETMIDNEGSTARDYLARERNYLSWVKLSVTLSAVSAALLTRFQFGQTTIHVPRWELDMNLPLGALFFVAAAASIGVGTGGFYKLQTAMGRRDSFVGRGGITDSVIWGIGALTLVSCILLLIAE